MGLSFISDFLNVEFLKGANDGAREVVKTGTQLDEPTCLRSFYSLIGSLIVQKVLKIQLITNI